jgi:APA family basic amino acid/polyamine antiporter
MPKTSDEGLIRGIRRWDLVAIAINGIIGAGIFGLPSKVYSLIGSYSLVAFVACALVVALIILCFCEVASRFDETGGPYLYAREAFGSVVGFEVGWLVWLARLTAFAANCNLLVNYLSYFWPSSIMSGWRATIIISVVGLLTVVNLIGVREAAIVSNVFTIGKLVPMLIFIIAGLFFLNGANFSFGPPPAVGMFSQSVLLLVYAFTGFEMAAIPAGETRDPRRNLPRGLLTATVVVALIYILIQVVCIGTLPDLGNSTKPLADAGTRFMGTAGGAIISLGAVISIAGNLNILMLSGSRVPFAMAEQQQLPALIARIHSRFFTPYVSVLFTATLMLILTLNSSFLTALTISTIARLVTYAATALALPVFRQRKDVPEAAFRLPGGPVIAIVALILAVWLLMNSTRKDVWASLIAAGVGLAIYFGYRTVVGAKRRAQHRAAQGQPHK